MKHSFGLDVLGCAHCGGCLELIAIVMSRAAIRSILDHLRLPTEPQPPARPPPPPDDDLWSP